MLDESNISEVKQLNADDAYLMILPQDFSSAGFTICVMYEARIHNGVNNIQYYTNQISSSPIKLNFEAGKQYTLHITLSLKGQKMGITVSMAPWQETLIDEPLKLLPDKN